MTGDEVWADEGGIAVRFERLDNEHVRISIIRGIGGDVIAMATLGDWRWERALEAVKLRVYEPDPQDVPSDERDGLKDRP